MTTWPKSTADTESPRIVAIFEHLQTADCPGFANTSVLQARQRIFNIIIHRITVNLFSHDPQPLPLDELLFAMAFPLGRRRLLPLS